MKRSRLVVAGLALAMSLISLPAVAAPAQAGGLPDELPYVYGDKNDDIAKAQRRLEWLGYDLRTKETESGFFGRSTKSAVKQFQRKFFVETSGKINKETWKTLNRVGDDVGRIPKVCKSEGKVICIDKTAKLLRYVHKGKVELTLDVRFGVPGLDTPTGTFRVWYRDRYATSGINGPDQPRAPMPYALFFNGDIAVHYSPTFAASGYYPGGGSHGCVNVADLKGVSWLFDQIPVGTMVHIYWD